MLKFKTKIIWLLFELAFSTSPHVIASKKYYIHMDWFIVEFTNIVWLLSVGKSDTKFPHRKWDVNWTQGKVHIVLFHFAVEWQWMALYAYTIRDFHNNSFK